MFVPLKIAVLLFITAEFRSVMAQEVKCSKALDIAFLIDDSVSINDTDFVKQIDFVSAIIESFSTDKTQLAALTFSNLTQVLFTFNSGESKVSAIAKLKGIVRKYGGRTETYDGLREARETIFRPGNGDREGVSNVLILLTDGDTQEPQPTFAQASKLKSANVKVVAIGIGQVTEWKLKPLASAPENENYIYATSYSVLMDKLKAVVKATCPCGEE